MDLSWSPDGSMLVSCSLQGELFIWQVEGDNQSNVPVQRLEGHVGMIKGVGWDPVNMLCCDSFLPTIINRSHL